MQAGLVDLATASGVASRERRQAGQRGAQVKDGQWAEGGSASEVCSWGQQHLPWVLWSQVARVQHLVAGQFEVEIKSLLGAHCPGYKLCRPHLPHLPTSHCNWHGKQLLTQGSALSCLIV